MGNCLAAQPGQVMVPSRKQQQEEASHESCSSDKLEQLQSHQGAVTMADAVADAEAGVVRVKMVIRKQDLHKFLALREPLYVQQIKKGLCQVSWKPSLESIPENVFF